MTSTGFALFNLGPSEFFWIFLIFLILFGATALPRLFRSLGKSVREFKKASEGLYDEMDKAAREEESRAGEQKEKLQQEETRSQTRPESEPPTRTNE
jgi:TatA/E family protein of Tat protein translocase